MVHKERDLNLNTNTYIPSETYIPKNVHQDILENHTTPTPMKTAI